MPRSGRTGCISTLGGTGGVPLRGEGGRRRRGRDSVSPRGDAMAVQQAEREIWGMGDGALTQAPPRRLWESYGGMKKGECSSLLAPCLRAVRGGGSASAVGSYGSGTLAAFGAGKHCSVPGVQRRGCLRVCQTTPACGVSCLYPMPRPAGMRGGAGRMELAPGRRMLPSLKILLLLKNPLAP